jgi:hypothetical protein
MIAVAIKSDIAAGINIVLTDILAGIEKVLE